METFAYSVKIGLTCLFLPLDDAHTLETLTSVWLHNSKNHVKIFDHNQDYHNHVYSSGMQQTRQIV